MHSIDFHAHHSPLGAYATFTCGRFGAGGGPTIEGVRPAGMDLVIGWADAANQVHALPFFTGAQVDLSNFAAGSAGAQAGKLPLADGLRRELGGGSDTWTCGDFSFAIHTPVVPLPDPAVAGEAALQQAILPVVTATVRLDNRSGTAARTLLFAITPGRPCRILSETVSGAQAVGWGTDLGIAAIDQPGLHAWVEWNERDWLVHRRSHLLGASCGFALEVPAGEVRELQLVFGFCRQGVVTTGIETRYYYTRSHPTLGSVLAAGVQRFPALRALAQAQDAALAAAPLDPHQRFLAAHAERSYWGNTQLLERGGDPLWVVLEGEYAMINTFDLTVDMCFYELARNPWTVRNVLDQFADRYRYVDQVARPADGAVRIEHSHCRDPKQLDKFVPRPSATGLPGGISFTHDMGVFGQFTPAGHSSYEMSGLAGCFSYMTAEQLLNWICTAVSYVSTSGDRRWAAERQPVFAACLDSFLNRDDPDATRRTGVVGCDSSRCAGGWEITTYDSLDASLGQARDNLYMATKGWAAWLGLAQVFRLLGDEARTATAEAGAARAAATIIGKHDAALGFIPAVFERGNVSAIIPAIEGLAFPLAWGRADLLDRGGKWKDLLAALERHLRAVLKPGVCLFADGGWKLSSTSDNSWMSKIFLCQHVAWKVYGIASAPESHAAHARWQQVGSRDWAMSDQCISGVAQGSKYYPRCVTADLWLRG